VIGPRVHFDGGIRYRLFRRDGAGQPIRGFSDERGVFTCIVTERNKASDQWRRVRCCPWLLARTRIHHRPATIFSNRVSPVLPRNVWAVGLDLPTLDYMLLIGS
jgi:hypothetical protein